MFNLIKKDYMIVIILFLLTLIFFWKIVFNPDKMVYPSGDFVSVTSLFRFFFSESLKRYGEVPLWNPYILSGSTFIGNPISLMFYPFNMLYIIFSSDLAFGYSIMLHVFLAGVFMYFFMRIIGLNKFGSLVSAITFMFSGIFIANIRSGDLEQLAAFTWIPLIFLLFELAIKKYKKCFFYGILTGIPLAMLFLGSHLQYAVYGLFGFFLYFLFRLIFIFKESKDFKKILKLIFIFLLAVSIGFGLSAVQFLPIFELTKHSIRTGGLSYEDATDYSLSPKHLIMFLMPEFFGTPIDNTYWGGEIFYLFLGYVGILPLILMLFAIILRKNKYVLIFSILTLIFLIISFGKYNPLFAFLYKFIPIFNMFRGPSRLLFLSVFSISTLAGLGSNFLTNILSKKDEKRIWLITKFLIVFCFLIILITMLIQIKKNTILTIGESTGKNILEYRILNGLINEETGNYYLKNLSSITYKTYSHLLENLYILLISLLISVLILILKFKKINLNIIKVLVVTLILFNLWIFGMKYINVENPNTIFEKTDIINFLEEDDSYYRVIGLDHGLEYGIEPSQQVAIRYNININDGYAGNYLKYYSEYIAMIGGNSPFELPKTYLVLIKDIYYPKLLGLLNNKYVVTTEKINSSSFELKFNRSIVSKNELHQFVYNKTIYIYENKEFLPRAFVVYGSKIIKDKEKIFDELKIIEPKSYVILEENGPVVNGSGKMGDVEIVKYSPNKIGLKTNMDNPGYLVLSNTWYPGWKAFDNKKEVHIFKTDYVLMSIYLDRGEHEIEFVYTPFSYRIGVLITIITISFLVVIIVYEIYRKYFHSR